MWQPPISARRQERKEQVLQNSGAPVAVGSVDVVDANGVEARLYRPVGDEKYVLVWIHGGGWVLHDVETFDTLARALATASACAVLAVEYRRAPEHPFPAAVDDCWSAVEWATDRFARVAVGGDSAGGNLAAVAAIRARDATLPLALQILVYPVIEYATETTGYHEHRQRYELFGGIHGYGAGYHDSIRWLWSQYVPDPARRLDVEASPLRVPSLAGVAPALVITAEHDILRPEGHAYAARLGADGVPVRSIDYPGQVHGFLEALAVFDDAQHAVRRIATALRQRFSAT